MEKLYKSGHFMLTEIRVTGKKQTGGILCFEGLPSMYGTGKEVTALEDGVVLKSGMNYDPHSREHRQGMVVTLSGHDGVSVTYGRLAHRYVNVGDTVRTGDIIGIEGNSGTGHRNYLTLEFRRNGRRINGCEYLGIDECPGEFKPTAADASEAVCRVCGIPDEIRDYIDRNPYADEVWKRILIKLRKC